MKIKKVILRIYIVLAICWSSWWLYRLNTPNDGIYNETIWTCALAPIPLFFGIWWILKAFDK